MNQADSLRRVIIVPRNGYANRFQAWASAAILADRFGADLEVLWEPEQVAPTQASHLFASSFVQETFLSPHDLTDLLGRTHLEMPRYLHVDQDRGLIFLAGHDRGEQHFMSDLLRTLETTTGISSLVIMAGGQFHVPDETDFAAKRKAFYRQIQWHPEIEQRASDVQSIESPYLGLHIRETDRSREAPTPKSQEQALVQLATKSGTTHVFLTCDTASARSKWSGRLTRLGLKPWLSDASVFNREDVASSRDAIVDWLLLGQSDAIVYSGESSFGHEAAVMTKHPEWCQGLRASWTLRAFRDLQRFARSATKVVTSSSASE